MKYYFVTYSKHNMRKYLFFIFIYVLLFNYNLILGQEREDAQNIIKYYKQSQSFLNNISTKIECEYWWEGNLQPNIGLRRYKKEFVFRSDGVQSEWLGKSSAFDDRKKIDNSRSSEISTLANGEYYINLDFYNPVTKRAPTAMMSNNYEFHQNQRYESPMYGGVMDGKLYGSNHKYLADLLAEDKNPKMKDEQEEICGSLCYVLEASTKYGKVVAWISPDLGYNALKWVIEKNNGQFYREGKLIEAKCKIWKSEFVADEVKKIDGLYVITGGYFEHTNIQEDGRDIIAHHQFKRTEIDLNPDFKALGAFQINLPEGTRVTKEDVPGISYIWTNGKLIPDIDELIVESFDRKVGRFLKDETNSHAKTPDVPIENPNAVQEKIIEPEVSVDHKVQTQEVKTKTQSKSSPLVIIVIMILVLLFVVIIGLWIYGNTKRKASDKQ